MSYFGWHPYVPVAEKRRQAERKLAELRKQGQSIVPVKIEGRTIAKSFWGKSWCSNLERYSDYENRVPRGQIYVRNGSVLDLQIAKGEVVAMVAGSSLYKILGAGLLVGRESPVGGASVCHGRMRTKTERRVESEIRTASAPGPTPAARQRDRARS